MEEQTEFEFPDELEAKAAAALEKEVSDEVELEVVDDTPEKDRGREPSEPPSEVTDEELEKYSESVQKRIKHITKGYHDERRAKEAAARERVGIEELQPIQQGAGPGAADAQPPDRLAVAVAAVGHRDA
jgi:hypothetical protein